MSTLNHIALAVSDPARTANLFTTVFGARLLPAEPAAAPAGPPETTLMLGDLMLVLVRGPTPTAIGAAHLAFNWPAADAARLRQALGGLGLRVEAPRAGPPDRALYVADWDHNLYELCLQPPN